MFLHQGVQLVQLMKGLLLIDLERLQQDPAKKLVSYKLNLGQSKCAPKYAMYSDEGKFHL